LPEINNIKDVLSQLGGAQQVEKALRSNLDWIVKSFEANEGHQGSSGKRTVLGQWEAPYPETTGYLIPTLLECSSYNGNLKQIALSQLVFFKSIQNEDGSFFQSLDNKEPIIFDTAQIVFGLMALSPHVVPYDDIKNVARKAVIWMHEQLDDEGKFVDNNYVENYNPAYYARIAMAMTQGEAAHFSKITKKTKNFIFRISDLQNDQLMFDNAGFHPDQVAYTHTIAYSLRGLWECSLDINNRKLTRKIIRSIDKLSDLILTEGKVAGSYNTKWKGDYSFVCSAGNAQLAVLYLLVYQRTENNKYLQVVPLLLKPLMAAQRTLPLNKGAVPSSIPIWGPYQKWSYTNWTQKFYADALVKILKLYESGHF